MANQSSGPVILLLEDEPMILMELSFAVEDLGATPVTATSAEKALEAIEVAIPDAAVLDFNLGRGKTCQAVSARLETLGVPFVLHSGDLMRQGEVISKMQAEVIPKPSDSRYVAQRALALVRQDAAE
ncbi:two-component response regulator [Rhodobacteraceae bacterium THAF1]|uniref:response regulator n=1 Tax=Palleronia sp. THAF1 TaxID=2587842 RepID=UPI000F3ED709|nr:response regulator [Palleronia sp. THAF1]QFU09450.1 two-component response regulator [Palleronia sp. THAF1]VDC21887.1 two-component response regulator [Rhodobacteraceae bacterium THAF1]